MFVLVLLTALGVGGATMLGALGGYCCRGAADRLGGEAVMSFAAGVMLSAAVVGLILPSLEGGGFWAVPVTTTGILCGAAFLLVLERLAGRMERLSGLGRRGDPAQAAQTSRVLLFVAAMAIHNLPEGLAAGVGFGTEDVPRALRLSALTLRDIKQNLFWAFCYNTVGIPIAAGLLYAFGGPLLSPMFAGAAMSLSSVCVVGNALRLGTVKL